MSTQPRTIQYATPPEIFAIDPLTPPPTEEKTTSLVLHIVKEIEYQRTGRNLTRGPWVSYSLDRDGYEELQHKIQTDQSLRGFVEDKLRYDYFPSASRLILRMPTPIHEIFIVRFVEAIKVQLTAVQDGAEDFAKEITPQGLTTLKFPEEEYGKHDPDAQFRHSKAYFPGIVIEVSYSQKRKDLGRLADDYILGSNAEIRAVVGIDIEYKKSKKATLSVWRPAIVRNQAGENELVAQSVVENQIFRDSSGNPSAPGTEGLRLRLRDFATEALAGPESQLCDPIAISSNQLFSLLKEAEDTASFLEQRPSVITANMPWVSKRRRESSPLEELAERDEKRFCEDES